MTDIFADKVINFTDEKSLLDGTGGLVVGVSGGADSVALLHLLCHLPEKRPILAVHLHHGLRGEAADGDAAFVERLCKQLSVPLKSFRVDVAALAANAGIGVEEAGRRERYRLFEQVRAEAGFAYILTAHTASDQAETVLMHLLRGCGTDGLSGIPAARGPIRRPLLCCTREEVEAYCARHNLSYVTDESNADIHYTRNRIRHQVLPLLRQVNPAADDAIIRLSSHAGEDSRFLCTMADQALEEASCGVRTYRSSAFSDQPLPIRRRMIHRVLSELGILSIEEVHILAVDRLLTKREGIVVLPQGFRLQIADCCLCLCPEENGAVPAPICVPQMPFSFLWLGQRYTLQVISAENDVEREKIHNLFFKSALDYDRIQGGLCVRGRSIGDALHPAGRGIGKTLKKLMNEWHVPADKRESMPVLCDEAGLVLVPGYTCDERVRITANTKHFLVWCPQNE